jgi:hypothetical protein
MTTMAVFVLKTVSATPFADFHDRTVFRVIGRQRVANHYSGRRFRWNRS